jgi:RNA polymerase sigma-70 factor, ECF subfamily
MEGYPVAEMPKILHRPVGTVKSRCARGRVKLAPLLGVLRGRPAVIDTARNLANQPGVSTADPARGPPVISSQDDEDS